MSTLIKPLSKDETRIGEYAAKQPLSGIQVISKVRVKGYSSAGFFNIDETKRAV